MPYDPNDNPYIPGDPYSYDLKWLVDQINTLIAQGGGVTSVNGQTGDVIITFPVTSVNGQTGDVIISAGVTSVNGQTGDVTLTIPTVPTNISAFYNDVGYITLADLPIYDGGLG